VLNKEKFIKKWALELNSQQFPNAEHVFWARDRSRNKKTIVVVDHYVPTYDKDAGSRTIFDYLKLFLDLDFNVKFIPDNFYRSEPYTTVLQQMGIEVLYGSWYNDHWKDWVKENASKIDMVLLSRPHIAIKYIDFIKEHTKASIFYYGHDLHFLREMRQYEIENDPKLLTSSKEWKQLELQLFNKADVVLTPSASELPLIKEMVTNKKIHVIKPYIFLNLRDPIQDFSNRKNILFVGGFTHVPNVDAVLWFVKEVWPLIQYEIDDVKFLIAGSNPPAEINKLSGKDDIDVLGFVSEAALQQLYSQIKLVVIPLRYGAGVKGKTVEAMYNGVPFVTTDFGIEGLPGNISFLKAQNSATEFANEVVRLYTAPKDELCSYSTNATQYIRKNFYYETIKSEMATIFSVSI
jgi:glycosyltransferase involved in cell wall biosynthesis